MRPSIFNDILGPISVGPSTSNTCGPNRIAWLSRLLLDGPLARARVLFPVDSVYRSSLSGMNTDLAYANGFLGRLPVSEQFLEAFDELERQRIDLKFEFTELVKGDGSLLSRHILTGPDGRTVETTAVSKGAGAIELTAVDGFAVSITGGRHELLVFTEAVPETEALDLADTLFAETPGAASVSVASREGRHLIQLSAERPLADELVPGLRAWPAVRAVRLLPALLPVVVLADAAPPFTEAAGLADYCRRRNIPLWQAALDYETAVSGLEEAAIRDLARQVVETAQRSVQAGLSSTRPMPGILAPVSARLWQRLSGAEPGRFIPAGVLSRATAYALAILEYGNGSGVIVCIPTAGAAGVVSGAILAACEELNLGLEDRIRAYLAAGVVGVSLTADNNFCGGQYGCQAEVGCASTMLAAALAQLAGADADRCLTAASVTLQNILGQICDPVAGFAHVPCFSRNLAGIANALVSANAVAAGLENPIPLEEAFEVMKASGRALSVGFRGGGGGLGLTPTGRSLAKRFGAESTAIPATEGAA